MTKREVLTIVIGVPLLTALALGSVLLDIFFEDKLNEWLEKRNG